MTKYRSGCEPPALQWTAVLFCGGRKAAHIAISRVAIALALGE
jgi:hypothetical protein